MNLDLTTIIIASSAAILSGMGTAIIAGIHENRKEKNRQVEREQDLLKIELKDLKIELYQLEKEYEKEFSNINIDLSKLDGLGENKRPIAISLEKLMNSKIK